MDIAKRYRTDPTLEAEGVWVDLQNGARLLIARAGNPASRRVGEQLERRYRASLKTRTLDRDTQEKIVIEMLAKTCLLGWEGIEYDGKKLKYSTENAIKALTELPDFRNLVADLAQDEEIFRAEMIEEEAGNSEKSSAGS